MNSKPKTQLLPDEITHIHKATGALPQFSHSLDNMLLPALNNVALNISTAENDALTNIDQVMHYVNHNPNNKMYYRSSDTILRAYSYSSYVCAP